MVDNGKSKRGTKKGWKVKMQSCRIVRAQLQQSD